MEKIYNPYIDIIRHELPLDECFDLIERKLLIGGRPTSMFFVDGLHDGEKGLWLMEYLLRVPAEDMKHVRSSQQFIEENLPFMDASVIEANTSIECCDKAIAKLYAGLVPIVVEGLDNIIIIDDRDYPARSMEEPEKEKSLRGAKDGFTETFMQNVGLIRRRIRDNNLIFKAYNVGAVSKADVAICYLKNKADMKFVNKLDKCLTAMNREALKNESSSDDSESNEAMSLSDKSLLTLLMREMQGKGVNLNPFPKVRYSQRPDVIAAHITEGKIAILCDNSPTVMLIPVSVFEFFQDVDDFYFPQLTGNYFRLLRIVNFIVILFLIPVYFLITEYELLDSEGLSLFLPEEDFTVPIFWQFILLEIAVDGLKLASLNTPTSMGTSLSVIGALILGEFSIESGWLISQTILCMAVVALAAFTQPCIELSYAMKFCRITMLIGAWLGGIIGTVIAGCIWIVIMGTTKTLAGNSYLYPLIPFDGKVLKRLLLRTQK